MLDRAGLDHPVNTLEVLDDVRIICAMLECSVWTDVEHHVEFFESDSITLREEYV